MSKDPDGTQTATSRQRKDCQRLADERGWQVVATYEDADLSGYDKRVVRPDFERMLIADMIAAG